MVARALHHRLEGRGEQLLNENVALRMRGNMEHAYLTAHRPRGDFGLAAFAEQQQQRPIPPTTICGFSAA